MKLKNAPERKRQRQLKALYNLQIRMGKRPDRVTLTQDRELDTLIQRTPSSLRGTRTKKRRGVPAK